YPPTIVAPDWTKAIAGNWWEGWEEFWLVQGAAPPPVTGGWRVGRIGFATAAPVAPTAIVHWHNEDGGQEIVTVIDDIDPNPFGLTIIAVGEPTPLDYALVGFASGHVYSVFVDSSEASLVLIQGFDGDNPDFDLFFPGGFGTDQFIAVSSAISVFVYADHAADVAAAGTVTITGLGAAP